MKRALSIVSLLLLASLAHGQERRSGIAPNLDPDCDATGRARVALLDSGSLATLKEDRLLGPGRTARLHAVAPRGNPDHAVILVHGIRSDFADLVPVVRRVAREGAPYQLHVLAYADWKKRTSICGRELADALRALRARRVTIVAHSLGGIVTRRALVDLTARGGIERFSSVRVLAVDTPWHGFDGPKDGFAMSFARPFMPDGLEDVRARSALFRGDPKSADPAEKAGLYGVALPGHVSIRLVFARSGDEAFDWTEEALAALPGKVAAFFTRGEPVSGDPKVENAWAALRSSATYPAFERHVRALPAIDARRVAGTLERHFSRLPGDHTSVLSSGELLRDVERMLRGS